MAKLGPNLILFRFKVGINGVLCFLDSRTMQSFVSPSVVARFGWATIKVGQTHQSLISIGSCNTDKRGGVGGCFGMWQGKVYG